MKVIDPAHAYELDSFEGSEPQTLQFIHKEMRTAPDAKSVGLHTVADGTTNEEVLRVLIDRTQTLNARFPCRENSVAITKMEEALMWFEKRTRDRVARGVEGTQKP